MAIVSYSDSLGAFDIDFEFCMLRFYLPICIQSCGVTEIEMLSSDVFRYFSGDSEEYESISRRILGETHDAPINYSVIDGGFRLHNYNVDIITEWTLNNTIKKICTVCERGNAKWTLTKVLN